MGSKKLSRFFVLGILFLSGCKSGEGVSLATAYQGSEILNGITRPVIARNIKTKANGSVTFSVFPILASAGAKKIQIETRSKSTLVLTAPDFLSEPADLELQTSCAEDVNRQVKLCWSDHGVDLHIKNDRQSYDLTLTPSSTVLPSVPASDSVSRIYTLDEILGRAKYLNYEVRGESERLLRAKENIRVARNNLLPKLNTRAILGVFTGDYLGIVGNVMPFIFPGNWYNWKASKSLFHAERSSFASLRGNEMNGAEGLTYLLLRDQSVLEAVQSLVNWMKGLQEELRQEEGAGLSPTGSADYYGTSIQLLERDKIALQTLIQTEFAELSTLIGLSPVQGVTGLSAVATPDLSVMTPLHAEELVGEVKERSFELKSLGSLIEAAKTLKKGLIYQFLDPETNGGLGFGTPAELKIAQTEVRSLQIKSEELDVLLEKKVLSAVTSYNSAIEAFQTADAATQAVKRRIESLIQRHLLNDGSVDEAEYLDLLAEAQLKLLGFQSDRQSAIQNWLYAKSQVDRLLLQGFYKNLDADLPQNNGG